MYNERIKKAGETYPELVSESFKRLYETIGFENILVLVEEFEGTTVYVPSMQGIFKDCIMEQVRKEFKGDNLKQLSRDYRITERTIRNYIYYY